jgi:hypothetical protein
MNRSKSSQVNSTIADSTVKSGKENERLLSNLQRDPPSKRKSLCDDEIEKTDETSRKEQSKEVRKKRKLQENKKREATKKKREMQLQELQKIWRETAEKEVKL